MSDTKPHTGIAREKLLELIVAEVDQARDIFQLAEQLAPFLPIKSFDDLKRAAEDRRLHFRDTPFDVESLRAHVPQIVFPIDDAQGLIERLGLLIRIVPEHLGVDVTSSDGARRRSRSSAMLGPALGTPTTRGLTAIVLDAGAKPHPIASTRPSPATSARGDE